MRVWQSKTPAYISHTFFLRRPRGFNTTGPFLMCDLFWNLLSKQPYILQLLHFNSLSRRREHQTSTAPPGLAAGIGRHRDLHRSPLRFLTSTPKPRAEGSSPSAPANPLVPRPCENRMAWGFFVPMPGLTRSTKSRFMLHPLLSSRIRPQPVSTAVFPSSTQNAPGFAFLGLFRVRFPLFCCFFGAKFSCRFLCILPHSGYKLKPSVIPCRREVSFLT